MDDSMESLNSCFIPAIITDDENKEFSLNCWHSVNLSNLWIPLHVLSAKISVPQQPKNIQLHTLQKEDAHQKIPTFSVYTDSGADIFESDSDNENDSISAADSYEKVINSFHSLPEKLSVNEESEHFELGDTSLTNCVPKNEVSMTETFISPESKKCNQNHNKVSPKIAATFCNGFYLEEDVHKNNEKTNISDFQVLLNENSKENSESFKEDVNEISISQNCSSEILEYSEFNEGKIKNCLHEILDCSKEFDARKIPVDDGYTKSSHALLYKDEDAVDDLKIDMPLFVINKCNDDDSGENNVSSKKAENLAKKHSKKERQQKKKASKLISLDDLKTDDSVYVDNDDHVEFVQNVLRRNYFLNGLHVNNHIDFPGLKKEEIIFVKPDIPKSEKQPEIKLQSVAEILAEPTRSEENLVSEKEVVSENEDLPVYGKIVIENIPKDVLDEDMKTILCGYGEIKEFEKSRSGKMCTLTVGMEFNIDCNIDWIVDCLNESNPFGASSSTNLKCYKVNDSCS